MFQYIHDNRFLLVIASSACDTRKSSIRRTSCRHIHRLYTQYVRFLSIALSDRATVPRTVNRSSCIIAHKRGRYRMALSSLPCAASHVLSTSPGVHRDFTSVGDPRPVLPCGTRSCGQGRLGNRERPPGTARKTSP